MENSKTFVVIPAYNEAATIGAVIQAVHERFANLVVVDDFSTDQTSELASQYPIYYLKHVINLGQGAALQTGNEFALGQGADLIVHFDADGQHRVEFIDKLIEPIQKGQADIVFGSRFLGTASKIPWFKRNVILPIARLVNWLATGVYLSDAHNGYRAMSRRAAELIKTNQNRMAHATEIVSLARQYNLRYVEVPVAVEYHEFGQGLAGGLRIVRDLISRSIFK